MAEEKVASKGESTGSADVGGPADLTQTIDFFKGARNVNNKIAGRAVEDPGAEYADISNSVDLFENSGDSGSTDVEGEEDTEQRGEEDFEGEDKKSKKTDKQDTEEEKDSESVEETDHKYSLVEVDGEEIKIPDDAKFTITVDGKSKEVTLSQMKSAAAGQVSYHKKFTELGAEKKKLKERERQIADQVRVKDSELAKLKMLEQSIKPHIENHNFEALLNEVYGFFEADALQLWDTYDQKNEKFYSEYAKQTPETKAAISLHRKTLLQQEAIKKKDARIKEIHRLEQESQQKSQILTATGLTEADVVEAWNELDGLARAGKLSYSTIEEIKKLPPIKKYEYAATFAIQGQVSQKIKDVVEKVVPDKLDDFDDIFDTLIKDVGLTNLHKATAKDLNELLSDVYGLERKKKPEQKKSATTDKLSDKATPRHKAARTSQNRDDLYGDEPDSPSFWGASFNGLPGRR